VNSDEDIYLIVAVLCGLFTQSVLGADEKNLQYFFAVVECCEVQINRNLYGEL
jgi:hypothetical protein